MLRASILVGRRNVVEVESDFAWVELTLTDVPENDDELFRAVRDEILNNPVKHAQQLEHFKEMLEHTETWEVRGTDYTKEELERKLTADEIFAKKQAKILSELPVEFHGALSAMAWESGHAYGTNEVLSHLTDLVEGLKNPIENYGRRVSRVK